MATKKHTGTAENIRGTKAGTASKIVAVWEDGPGDPQLQPPLTPLTIKVPNQAAQPLPFKIKGTPLSPKSYQSGTRQFRFYAAGAWRRTVDFSGAIVPPHMAWQVGRTLRSSLMTVLT